jgi:hypothetical protein
VFLALHRAAALRGFTDDARRAIARAIPRLVTRVRSLAGTPYARAFLTQLTINTRLLATAADYDLVPAEISAILAQ